MQSTPLPPLRLPRALRAAGLVVALLAHAACAERAPREFRIGLIGVLEGSVGIASGIPAQEGARLAVDEINAAGGVDIGGVRYRLVLVERGIAPRPDAAAAAARGLINLDSVHAIVGPQISSRALAAAQVAEGAGVPLISPMASNPAVTTGRRFVTRLAFVDAYQGQLLARYAYDSLGLRRAAMLFDAANPYGRDISKLFREVFEAQGGRVVSEETFTSDAAEDFRPQLRRALANRPDALLLPNYSVHDSIQVRQARELGFRGRFLGTDTWDPVGLSQIDSAYGAVIVANWDRTSPRAAAKAFIAAYEARYQHPPRTTAAATYDAVHLLAATAHRAGSLASGALTDSLRAFGPYEGASARFVFQGTGDPVRGGVILEFQRGRSAVRFLDLPPG